MEGSITWVGVDAHKKTLAVAALAPKAAPEQFTVDNTEKAIRKLARRLKRTSRGGEIRACYEAGTCGYALQRRLEASVARHERRNARSDVAIRLAELAF